MPILEVNNLCKMFGAKPVLKNVSFAVEPGEITGFLGPNGAGKTTAIKAILGLLKSDAGEIKINGYDIKTNLEKALEKVGGIIESPELYGYMSGYDNLKMSARLYEKIEENEINDIIKLVGLENRIKEKVSKYSLGMRQRLGVAQAMLHKPNLLILDEPTNGLDPAGIKDLRNMLREYVKNGAAVLVSSHLLAEMELMCDRIIIIENGEILSVKLLDEMKGQENGKQLLYKIELDALEKAAAVFEEKKLEFKLENGIFAIELKKEDAAELIKILIEAQINIYSVYYEQKSLEEAFLEVTHQGSIK